MSENQVKNPGWFWVLTAIIFPTTGAVLTALVFLYGNFSTTKDAQGMDSRITEVKEEIKNQIGTLRDEQKDIRVENIRLRSEVRDELKELRGLVLELVRRTPKRYSNSSPALPLSPYNPALRLSKNPSSLDHTNFSN